MNGSARNRMKFMSDNIFFRRALIQIGVGVVFYSIYVLFYFFDIFNPVFLVNDYMLFCVQLFYMIFVLIYLEIIVYHIKRGLEKLIPFKIELEILKTKILIVKWCIRWVVILYFASYLIKRCAFIINFPVDILKIFLLAQILCSVCGIIFGIYLVSSLVSLKQSISKEIMINEAAEEEQHCQYVISTVNQYYKKQKEIQIIMYVAVAVFAMVLGVIKYQSYIHYSTNHGIRNFITAMFWDDRESLLYHIYGEQGEVNKEILNTTKQSVSINGVCYNLTEYICDGSILYAKFDIVSSDAVVALAGGEKRNINNFYICNGAGAGYVEIPDLSRTKSLLFAKNRETLFYSFYQMFDPGEGFIREKDKNRLYILQDKEISILSQNANLEDKVKKTDSNSEIEPILDFAKSFHCEPTMKVLRSEEVGKNIQLSALSFRYFATDRDCGNTVIEMTMKYHGGKRREIILDGLTVDENIDHGGNYFHNITEYDSIDKSFRWKIPQDLTNIDFVEVIWNDGQIIEMK